MDERRLAEAIFDAFVQVGKDIQRADRIRRKEAQIRSVCARRCGNCDHWMKISCVPEKQHGQRKSMNSVACRQFQRDRHSMQLEEQFRQELTSQRLAPRRLDYD